MFAQLFGGSVGTPIPALAWYKLDGNALDSSGNGYHGTVNGPIASEGVYGQGYWFDGTNDYISADSAAGAFSGAATWTAWVKSNKTSGEFISKFSPASGRSYGIQVDLLGRLNFRASSDGTSVAWARPVSPAGRIDDGEWRHVAVSYNGTTFSVFFNGVPVYSAGETRAIYAGDAPLWLGAQSEFPTTLPFRGTLDDVRIYDRALSEDNIKRIMESQDNEPLEELQ